MKGGEGKRKEEQGEGATREDEGVGARDGCERGEVKVGKGREMHNTDSYGKERLFLTFWVCDAIGLHSIAK